MLRFDPFFRDIDRLTQQLWGAVPWGTAAQPALVPMDAWRDGEKFVVEFDLPGVLPESLDVNVEHACSRCVRNDPPSTRTAMVWCPNARAACSAGRSTWATASTPTTSTPITSTGCCG